MDALFIAIKNYLLDHWTFFAAAIVLGYVLQWLKLNVMPKEKCAKSRVRLWLRRLLPLIAMVVGGSLGFIPGIPVSVGTTTTPGRVLYFALAGVFASYVFNVIKQISKNYGVVISGGEDDPEATPKTPDPTPKPGP